MTYHLIEIVIYILSVFLAMYALSCFHFDRALRKNKQREFYAFYIMATLGLAYLFASFLIAFGNATFLSM